MFFMMMTPIFSISTGNNPKDTDKGEILSKEKKNLKCKHCGGTMRYYVNSTTCQMCGRYPHHECENCQFPKEKKDEE